MVSHREEIHRVTSFPFYISDMSDPLKNLVIMDFTEPENCLQLSDDTLVMAEYEDALKFRKLFGYIYEEKVHYT